MKKVLMVMGVAASVLVAGCASVTDSVGLTTTHPAYSGFLPDYSKLQPAPGREGMWRYISPTANLKPYTKLYLDPVQVFVSTDAEAYKGVDPHVLTRIADAFHGAFVKAVSPEYEVVSVPGPGVLRVRLAITGLQAVSPSLGVTDFIPIKAVYDVGRNVAGQAPRLAEMSAEFELIDDKGQQVAAAVATRKADKNLPQGQQITWNDLAPIANLWAKTFRQDLDRVRGVAKP